MTYTNYHDSPHQPPIILITNQTQPAGTVKCQVYVQMLLLFTKLVVLAT